MITHDPVRLSALASALLAVLALASMPLIGWTTGLALAAGLAIGAANGFFARRALDSGLPFRATSLGRMGVLTAIAVAIGFAIGQPVLVAAAAAGIAVSQFALAVSSVYVMVTAR